MQGRVDVRVLGPVDVLGPNGPAQLSGARQRCLVALLALAGGRPIGQTRLVDALWGEDPPRTAIKTLHSHMARVRQALAECGLPGLLVTQGQSYLFAGARAAVDALRFEDHVAAARRHAAGNDHASAAAQLRAALELWRGDALAGAAPDGWAVAEVARLHDARLAATEELWEAELAQGRHATAADEVGRLLVEHPARERLVGLYMLALYRLGRHAEALEAYQRLRRHLDEELGVDPGPELQQRFTAILRRDPALAGIPASLVPAQLPAAVGHFTGRTDELSRLDALLERGGEARIAVVSGQAGIGKTALAIQWAHRTVSRFPAGQLVLDLRGHDPGTALSQADALAQLLRGLGVPASRIPMDVEEMTNAYRSLTHGRPILIVADNAAGPEQVLPLVPATATGFLLVTSRARLSALATRHAVEFLGLDALTDAEAGDLLCRVAGGERTKHEPQALALVTRLCGGLPLALRIAAARLATEPQSSLGQLAADLAAGNTLDELAVPGDSRSVRTVFASAYRCLPAGPATLFRRLGLLPGPVFGEDVAAAITGMPLDEARRSLARLAADHLLAPAGGRFRFHDLLRLYAAECAHRDEHGPDLAEVTESLLSWYLAVADAANQVIGKARNRVRPQIPRPPSRLPFAGGHDEVLSYLDGEHPNMIPVVRFAAEHGHDVAAWQLTYLLTGFYEYRGRWAERFELCQLGLAAAQRLGDPFAAGLMYSTLGVACVELHRFDEALDNLHQAFARMESAGDKRGQGVALGNMAVALLGLHRYPEAVTTAGQALVIHRASNHTVGIALALNNIGYAYAELGETELAQQHLAEALELSRALGNGRLEAGVLNSLGQAHLYGGDFGAALDLLHQALAAREAIGDRRNLAETLHLVGLAHLRLGQPAAALDRLGQAEELSRETADHHREAVIRNTIGEAHLSRGELEAAEAQLRLALELRTRISDPHEAAAIRANLDRLAALRASHRRRVPEDVSKPRR